MAKSFKDSTLDQKYKELEQAILTFDKSMAINLAHFSDEIELDTVKSGQIQKFEYTIELTWKFLKSYLRKEKGIDAQGPKDVFRDFARFNYFKVDEIETFIEMIDNRNKIAHEYKDYIMAVIYPKLSEFKDLISKILDVGF